MADKPQKSWQARSEFNERRYRRVDTRVWNDARVRGFSPNGRLVWVLLLTAPSTTAIPGLFRMREEEGAALCGLSLEEFRIGYQEGYRVGLVEADWEAGVVWLKKAPRYEWPTSPKIVSTWRKVLRAEIPESPLVARAMAAIYADLLSVFEDPAPFKEAYADAFPIPYAVPYQEGYPAQYAVSSKQDAGEKDTVVLAGADEPRQADRLPNNEPAPTPPAPEALQEIWNRVAHPKGLPRWSGMGKRKDTAKARLKAEPRLGAWEAFLRAKLAEPFFLGENERRWKADVDWFLRAERPAQVTDFADSPPPTNAPGTASVVPIRRLVEM